MSLTPRLPKRQRSLGRNSQDKKWAARRADAKKKALVKYNLDEDKLDDQRKASSEARQAKKQAEFAFIAERQAKDKARIKKKRATIFLRAAAKIKCFRSGPARREHGF